MTKRQLEKRQYGKKTKGQKNKKKRQRPKREFNIVTSGQFRTLATFFILGNTSEKRGPDSRS